MSLTVFLNIRLIVVIRRSRTFVGQQLASSGNNDSRNASSNRVTVTLLVILIVYLVCQLPMTAVQVLTVINEIIRPNTDIAPICGLIIKIHCWTLVFALSSSIH
jgi:hypothetical protein